MGCGRRRCGGAGRSGLDQVHRSRCFDLDGRRRRRHAEGLAVGEHRRRQAERRQHGPARAVVPVEVAGAPGGKPGRAEPQQHGEDDRAQQPGLPAQEFQRLAGAGLGDDAEVVGRDALSVIGEQVEFGRQGQEGRQQRPVEPCRALEQGPDGDPGEDPGAQQRPRVAALQAHQARGERRGGQRGVAQQEVQVGGAQQRVRRAGHGQADWAG